MGGGKQSMFTLILNYSGTIEEFLKCVYTFRRMWGGGTSKFPPIMFGHRTSLTVNIFSPNFKGVSSIQIYIDSRDIFGL